MASTPYIVQGLGRMWRRQDATERAIDLRPGTALTIPLRPGTALTIPVGTAFQFRSTGGPTRVHDHAQPRPSTQNSFPSGSAMTVHGTSP